MANTTNRMRATTPRIRPRPVTNNFVRVERDVDVTTGGWDLNRASLGAIIAGALAALAVMLAMSVLGLAIGATTLDAMVSFDEEPVFDPETGLIIWIAVTNLAALFVGGWVAGRLAGSPLQVDGLIHGGLVWALVTLVSLALFASAAGRLLSGAAAVVGDGLAVIDDGVETIVPEAVDAVERRDLTLNEIRTSARDLAEDTDNPNLQPDTLEAQGEEAGDIVAESAGNIATEPSSAATEIEQAVDELLELGAVDEADRQDVINVIVANSNLTEEEARTTLENWETQFEEVDINAEEVVNDVTETVTGVIGDAAAFLFMGMVMGAFAGMAGGYVGAPDVPTITAVARREEREAAEEAAEAQQQQR
ncbi:MAG: hypothetical protein HC915_13760 [Anaerolineae bacterium]|nr:hypothetical protein [Anaerolineae bacterium]